MTNKTNNNKNNYFACANTSMGFINLFNLIIESQDFDKIYIIKGCGCDGSDILREIAQTAENKMYSIEYFLCPVDTNRLDGIIIKELKTAVISDKLNISSTSKYPVIIENSINYHDFYDETSLIANKEEILKSTAKKEEYINLAYKFLRAADELSENTVELSKKYLNVNKLNSSVGRLLNRYVNEKRLQPDNKQFDEYRFINSVSSSGLAELFTLENQAEKIFYISGDNSLGWHYTRNIADKCENLCKVVCPDALNPKKIKAVYLKDSKILFTIRNRIPDKIYDDKYTFINMDRFIDPKFKKDNKQKLRFINKCYKSIIDESVKYFKEVDVINKHIENIYESTIKNIYEKNKYTEVIINKILP